MEPRGDKLAAILCRNLTAAVYNANPFRSGGSVSPDECPPQFVYRTEKEELEGNPEQHAAALSAWAALFKERDDLLRPPSANSPPSSPSTPPASPPG